MTAEAEDEPSGRGGFGGAAAVSARLIRQRPTKLQIVALGLITLLSLGPLVAIVAVARTDQGPVTTLIEGPSPPPGGAHLSVTLTGVSATAGEVRTRVVMTPDAELLAGGRPTIDLVLRVNDVRGADTYDFRQGEPLRPVDVNLALENGSVIRYPFDEYNSGLSITLATGDGPDAEPVPFTLDLLSNVDEFDLAPTAAESLQQPTTWALVELEVGRETTTTAYAVWMMALMWGLSIAA